LARLFISHSSLDNPAAVGFADWLRREGFDDVFLDLDADTGIKAGERWERALYEAARRCEAVLFLVSRAWLASEWCEREFDLAHKLNKRMFGVFIEDVAIGELRQKFTQSWHFVSLAVGQDHEVFRIVLPQTQKEAHVTFSREGLVRLKAGLTAAGLDPRYFAWPPPEDPDRRPYRGFKPLEAEDAGIFFGRDAPIIEALGHLRGMREAAPPRLFVILGASGAGKSSFMRAGLLPRLARDDRNFLTLAPLRPERNALNGENGLVNALWRALRERGQPRQRSAVRAAVEGGAASLRPLLLELAAGARPVAVEGEAAGGPTLVVPIDQGEELFAPEGAREGARLLELLRDLLASDGPALLVIVTIRSDAYDKLESAQALDGIAQRTMPLPPMPRGAYQTVIEGPAARLARTDHPLQIDKLLTRQLLEDMDKGAGDALPLLAFTLEQLDLDYGIQGALRLEDYQAFGGIGGAIDAAVERALDEADADPGIPGDHDARLALLRQGLVPWLVGIDPGTLLPRRRKARIEEIPLDTRPLIRRLVDQRLLSTDAIEDETGKSKEVTIEPAHEALIRQWGKLAGWLKDDVATLAALESAKIAARDWAANAKHADWLNHAGGRLQEVEKAAGRPDLAAYLTPEALDYLAQCRAREDDARAERLARRESEREEQERRIRDAEAVAKANRRTAQVTRRWLAAALVLLAVAAVAGGAAFWQWRVAQDETARVDATREDAAEVARLARSELSDTNDNLRGRVDDLLRWLSPAWAATLHHWRSAAYETARDFAAERTDLDAEMRAEPGFVPLLIASSDNYDMSGNAEAAIRDAQEALKAGATDAVIYGNLALAEAMRRDYRAAIGHIGEALSKSQRTIDVTESLVAPDVQEFTSGFKLWVRHTDYLLALRYLKAALLAMQGDMAFVTALDEADAADRDTPFSRTAYLAALNWEWLVLRGQALGDQRTRQANDLPIRDYGADLVEALLWRRVTATRGDYNAYAERAFSRFAEAYRAAPRPAYRELAAWSSGQASTPTPRIAMPASPLAEAQNLEVLARESANGPNSGSDAHRMAPAVAQLSTAIHLLDPQTLQRPLGRQEEDLLIDLLRRRGEWRLASGDHGGAAQDARRVLAIDDKIADAHRLLGDALPLAKDRRRQYERALALDPGNAGALAGLGWKIEGTKPADAIELAGREQRFRRYGASDYDRLSGLQSRAGHAAEALVAIERAIALAPWTHDYYVARRNLEIQANVDPHIADLHFARGLHDEAEFSARTGRNAAALAAYTGAWRSVVALPQGGAVTLELDSLTRDFDAFLVLRYGRGEAEQWWRSFAENPVATDREKQLSESEAQRLGTE
jgi:hypothetical protein